MIGWHARPKTRMGNTRTTCGAGHSHRSKLESSVCAILQKRERDGEIKLLQVEDHVKLSAARITYVADFRCEVVRTGEIFWVEAKGMANDRWPVIKKLWAVYGPGTLHIYQGTYMRPSITETIVPSQKKET